MINAELNRKICIGIVEDNVDPRRLGRIKVRVQSYFEEIPLEHIPWAAPYKKPSGTNFDVPAIGKIVNVIFEEGCLYSPFYIYADKYNINLQDKLESLSDDEYTSFVALLFDYKTQIYSDDNALTFDYLLNKLTIKNDSINLELKDNMQKINLGSNNATQRAILGDKFLIDWFKEFVNLLLNPSTMTGNLGAPILKPQLDIHLNKFLSKIGEYLSSNVYIVDNNQVNILSRDSATSEVGHDDVNFAIQNKKDID